MYALCKGEEGVLKENVGRRLCEEVEGEVKFDREGAGLSSAWGCELSGSYR